MTQVEYKAINVSVVPFSQTTANSNNLMITSSSWSNNLVGQVGWIYLV